jgi:hypothetical protein
MLIGVLVHIVQVIAVAERERSVVGFTAQFLRLEWLERFHDADAVLSKADFQSLLVEPRVAQFLQDVGIDVLVLVDLSDMIFDEIAKEKQGISFEDFVEAVLNMRGTNPVTVQDVKSQLRIVKRLVKESAVTLEKQMQMQIMKNIKHTKRVLLAVRGELPDDDSDGSESESGKSEKSDTSSRSLKGRNSIGSKGSMNKVSSKISNRSTGRTSQKILIQRQISSRSQRSNRSQRSKGNGSP